MKRNMGKPSKKNSILKRALPLAVAISLISSGNLLAAPRYIDVAVDDGGKVARFDTTLMTNNKEYRNLVLNSLRDALLHSKSLIVKDSQVNTWIDVGSNITSGIPYNKVVDAISNPDPNVDVTEYLRNDGNANMEYQIDESGVVAVNVVTTALQEALEEAQALLYGDTSMYDPELVTSLEDMVREVEDILKNPESQSQNAINAKANELNVLIQQVFESDSNLPYNV